MSELVAFEARKSAWLHMNLSFWDTVAADLMASKLLARGASWTKILLLQKVLWSFVFHPRFMCVFWYRVNRYLYERNLPFRNFLSARRFYWFGNDISYYAEIGPGLRLLHLSDIAIGGSVKIGKNAWILNGVTVGAKRRGEDGEMPVIGDDVYIGAGSKVIGGVRVGNNVTIGALTLCNKNIPDNSIVYGIPPNQTVKS